LYVLSAALFSSTFLFSVCPACPHRLSLFFNPFNNTFASTMSDY
jgi:hypothetical protein